MGSIRFWVAATGTAVSLIAVSLLVLSTTAAPAMGSADIHSPKAQTAKTKCHKGYKRVWRHGRYRCVTAAPLPLSQSEVRSAVEQEGAALCQPDPTCRFYGAEVNSIGGPLSCNTQLLYSWSCYGYAGGIDEHGPWKCTFRQIVDRVGYHEINSHRDWAWGFDCQY